MRQSNLPFELMEWIKSIIRLIIVMLLQVLLINNLHFLGVCHPFIYIFFLTAMPITLPRWVDMLIGAIVGLMMDIFCNSIGVHTAACIALMYVRPWFIRNLVMDYDRLNGEVSGKTISMDAYIKYVAILVAIHHALVFVLSAWSFSHLWLVILQIVVSSFVSFGLIVGYELIRK